MQTVFVQSERFFMHVGLGIKALWISFVLVNHLQKLVRYKRLTTTAAVITVCEIISLCENQLGQTHNNSNASC